MANRRDLKKDLNWLTHEVISDCLIYLEFNKVKDETPVAKIIDKIITKRSEAFTKINENTSAMNKREVKDKFNSIVNEFFDTANSCFEDLSKLSKK
ncbi:MAG: hypothetical protein C0596_11925 [Marinilabiliales bacterium]|nr:MAG: hypothetical protein C0596_11925 [Marinilabiliales bacterium]